MKYFFKLIFLLSISNTLSAQNPVITRGPYLQVGTPSSLVIKWNTQNKTDSKVCYGTSVSDLKQNISDKKKSPTHEIILKDLKPDTKYYYSIGSSNEVLQGDSNNYFYTAPLDEGLNKVRVWVTGDCGNGSSNQMKVRDAFVKFNGSTSTNLWLLLGDNAYDNGLEEEYQNNFFNIYKDNMLKHTVLWPAPGNHDYANNYERQKDHVIPYYDFFTVPENGEAGGIPSKTKSYYSFNYGNTHFVSLDSYGIEDGNNRIYDTTSTQIEWLKRDLSANSKLWTVVYFHHPPYTKTSHNSDTENELIRIRENLIRIFERNKVDLVLSGHSHGYERSRLMQGHFGTETSFNDSLHALSKSSGKYEDGSSCPYVKSAGSNGTIYVVAGSSGKFGGTSEGYPHNAMYYSNNTVAGSLILDINKNKLDVKWLDANGNISDNFTMFKNVNKTETITVPLGQPATLTASWEGDYKWNTGETSRSIMIKPDKDAEYKIQDDKGCLMDMINVKVR